MSAGGFNWVTQAGVSPEYNHVATAGGIAVLLLTCGALAGSKLAKINRSGEGGIIPESKLTFRNTFEIIAEKLYGLVESTMGHHAAPIYYPLIGTLFLFIFICNVVGLIPGFLPPTENLNTTLALGVFVFVYYNIEGFRANGIGYLKHFMGPVLWLAPLIFLIEVASNVVRPLSLGLRLRGNISGDHLVLGLALEKLPYLVPTLSYGLGLFVSFIQAFVFCLLTMVYISMSTSHDH